LIGAAIAVCAWSTGTILAKYIDMGSLAIGFYRFAFFGLAIVGWMQLRGTPFRLRVIRDSMWGGLALGADIALFFSAVKLTSIVNATIIGSMQPVVVGVIAARFFGERIGLRNVAWSLVALTGTVVVVATGADDGTSDLRGDLLALAAMLSWSAYFIASKNSKHTMTSTEFTAGTSLWTMAICIPLGFAFGQDMSWPSASNWGWLILMAATSGLIGHAMMNWSLVRIPLWIGSTFTLLIPVFSALLAWAVLGETVTVTQGVAMAVVVGALAMVVRNQSQPIPTPTIPSSPTPTPTPFL
jgi:drug/metabolite transporter (DMT)-like permease